MKLNQRGFIALISTLIISVVFLAAVLSVAQFGLTARYSLLYFEQKAMSESLAHGCAEIARIVIANDSYYEASNRVATFDTESCTIVSIISNEPISGISEVLTRSRVGAATTNLRTLVDMDTQAITRIEELPSL